MSANYTSVVSAKVVVLGDQGVGKTSFLRQHLEQKFFHAVSPTIGVSYYSSVIRTGCHMAKLQLWDTAGQERYKAVVPIFYRNADIAILMYDITDELTFENIKQWGEELHNNLMDNTILYYVIGNKTDLRKRREITTIEALEYAKSIDAKYFECSATEAEGVEQIFSQLAKDAVKLSSLFTHSCKNEPVEEIFLRTKVEKKKKRCCHNS